MSKFKFLMIYPNCEMATLLPVGISSLAASLKQNGIEFELFDTTYYHTEEESFEKKKEHLLQVRPFSYPAPFKGGRGDLLVDLKNLVYDYRPDLIGISIVEDTLPLAMMLLKFIRACEVPIIAGGVGVNWNKRRLWDSGLIDILCIGEGENVLVEVCKRLQNNDSLIYVDGLDLPYSSRPFTRSKLVDINKLPFPDFSIFPDDRIARVMHGQKYRMLHVEVDRGCPYQCTYCCAPALKRLHGKGYYRRKSNERIVEEINWLVHKYNPDYIDLNSETLLVRSAEELKGLFGRSLREAGLQDKLKDIPFWCQARPEDITEEKVSILKDAGVADFQLGIEHGNENFRRNYLNRKGSNKKIIESCRLLSEYEIPFTVNMIMFPNLDTRDTIFDSINLCKEVVSPYLKTINVYHLALYRGTKLRTLYVDKGWIPEDSRTNQLLDGNTGFKWEGLSEKEFKGLQRTFPMYVRMDDYSEVKKAETDDKIFKRLRKKFIERYYS